MMMRGHDNLSVNDQMEDLRERMRLLQGDRKVGLQGGQIGPACTDGTYDQQQVHRDVVLSSRGHKHFFLFGFFSVLFPTPSECKPAYPCVMLAMVCCRPHLE